MNADQIGSRHRSRVAYIYVRQSTAHQLIHHPESQRLQRDLRLVLEESLGQGGNLVGEFHDIELRSMRFYLSGLNLGDVENIVDQGQ